MSDQLGDLDRVARIVKLNGYVQCVDGFTGQAKVVNGASDLLAEVGGIPALFMFFLDFFVRAVHGWGQNLAGRVG